MKILVTFAMDFEFAAWRRQHEFREVSLHPYPLYAADIGGSTVRVLLTGVGVSAAGRAIRHALESPADLCISSGFAGALQPDIQVGEVLVARLVHRAEKEVAVACDRELFAAASDTGARCVERFVTSERLVSTPEEKASLAQAAEAVEMESFVILAEAARHGVRAVAIRAASDSAASRLPYDLSGVTDERGRVRVGALAAQVLRHPRGLPDLLRLARDCREAGQRLGQFLDYYLAVLHSRLDLSHAEIMTA